MEGRPNNKKQPQQRVIVFLDRQEVDLLDKIGKDTLFSSGKKLSRTKIISTLVDLLMELDIDGRQVSSLAELKQRIKQKVGSAWPSTRELLTFEEKKQREDKDIKNE